MKYGMLWVMVVWLLAVTLAGCPGSDNGPDGDTPDGDVVDGDPDTPDGDQVDGDPDLPDGDQVDGDPDLPDGDKVDGDTDQPDGDKVDGDPDLPDGDVVDGDPDIADGDVVDGDPDIPDGDVVDGDPDLPDGDKVDGDPDLPDGDVVDGDPDIADGDVVDGDPDIADGDVVDGDPDIADGDGPDGDAPDGDWDVDGLCLEAGESAAISPDAPPCCGDLVEISCDAPNAQSVCEECEGTFFCAACGDDSCGAGENPCNCPQDCDFAQDCIEDGGSWAVTADAPDCCNGLTQIGCDAPNAQGICQGCTGSFYCTQCGNGECGPGETYCNCSSDCEAPLLCVEEGESGTVGPNALDCCDGLVSVGCSEPEGDPAECSECTGTYYCSRCGNDECGPGENECNCPADCEDGPSCIQEGGTTGMPGTGDCCEGLTAIDCSVLNPQTEQCEVCFAYNYCTLCGNGQCGPGENYCNCEQDCPLEPPCIQEGRAGTEGAGNPDCCEGLDHIDCDTYDVGTGSCQECTGSFYCTYCGNGSCDTRENECNCPEDCESGSTCIQEGEEVPNTTGAPNCCSGLYKIPCDFFDPDNEVCIECGVLNYCTRCGNGQCGENENQCNCPTDCDGTNQCVFEGEMEAIGPDQRECCQGLVAIGCDEPNLNGSCYGGCDEFFYCTYCGNGLCGPGENKCNCPQDCDGQTDCAGEGQRVYYGPNEVNCCTGLIEIGCDEADAFGNCLPCNDGFFCTNCGDRICGPGESKCNCPRDCGLKEDDDPVKP